MKRLRELKSKYVSKKLVIYFIIAIVSFSMGWVIYDYNNPLKKGKQYQMVQTLEKLSETAWEIGDSGFYIVKECSKEDSSYTRVSF